MLPALTTTKNLIFRFSECCVSEMSELMILICSKLYMFTTVSPTLTHFEAYRRVEITVTSSHFEFEETLFFFFFYFLRRVDPQIDLLIVVEVKNPQLIS